MQMILKMRLMEVVLPPLLVLKYSDKGALIKMRRVRKPVLVLAVLLLIASVIFAGYIVSENLDSDEELAYKNSKNFTYAEHDNINFLIEYTNDKTLNQNLEENIEIIFQENKNVFESKEKDLKVKLSLNADYNLASWLFVEETDNLSEVFGTLIFDTETKEVIKKEKLFVDDLKGLSMLVRDQLSKDENLRYHKKTYEKTTPEIKNFQNIMLDNADVAILFKRDHFDLDDVIEIKLDYDQIMPYFSDEFVNIIDEEYVKPDVSNVRYIDPNKQMAALTFDDGPNYNKSLEVANYFFNHNARVTYFWLGSRISEDPETVLKVHKLGHEVASHSYNHKDLTIIDDQEFIKQTADVSQQIKDLTNQELVLFRPPGGITNKEVRDKLNSPLIMWNVDPMDWKNENVDAILENINANISDGAIILMHDLYETSIIASKQLLDSYQDSYQFVTISEMFQYKGIPLNNGELYYNGKGR